MPLKVMYSISLAQTQHESITHDDCGWVVLVRGSVIDVFFPEQLPELYNQLQVGEDGSVTMEVLSHLNSHQVRGIALNATAGLAGGPWGIRAIRCGYPWESGCWAGCLTCLVKPLMAKGT
jgi:hypothetical protein